PAPALGAGARGLRPAGCGGGGGGRGPKGGDPAHHAGDRWPPGPAGARPRPDGGRASAPSRAGRSARGDAARLRRLTRVRLAFVVQRYGAEVAGGAETLCRRTAHALSATGFEVTVYTTTARDYLTWAPHYAAGETRDGAVTVRRFTVRPPDPARSAALVRALALRPGDAAREAAWARAQGPVAPGLLTALARHRADEVVVCWTYLYATTQLALPVAREGAVLVPLAHDEPTLRLDLSRGVTRIAAGLAFMTPEELDLVDDLHGVGDRPSAVVGVGVDPGREGDPARAHAACRLPARFACYVGRVDAAKGVDALVRAHAAYRAAGGDLGL